MKAVVLVGGFGTRLRPLTLSAPKQMLPVVDQTMLERVVGALGRQGVDEVVLSLGYQPDAFTSEFPDGVCAGVKLIYAVEPEPLDTAGAIAYAAGVAGLSERVLAVNGDVLSDLDVAELWRRHEAFGADATIALTPVEDPSRYGVVPIDAENRVDAFIEKPDPGTAPSNWINAGTYVLEPSVLDSIPRDRKVSIERETFPALVERQRLFAVQSDAYWIDAGTPEAYLQANLDLLSGDRGEPEQGVHPGAHVDPDATVTRSVVGDGAVIAAGARVTDSIVMGGASVGERSCVDRSIVGGRSKVGPGCELRDLSVVGYDQPVDPATTMTRATVPEASTWQ